MNYKLNQELVDKLAKGEIALNKCDNTNIELLRQVLKTAFPNGSTPLCPNLYFERHDTYWALTGGRWSINELNCIDKTAPQIPLSDFILKDREIVGYKLIKPEYEKAAIQIAHKGDATFSKFASYPKYNGANFTNNSLCAKQLRKAGVLDLWFEPVYKEEDKPKEIENLPLTLEIYRAKFRLIQIITQDLMPHAKLKELITEYSK